MATIKVNRTSTRLLPDPSRTIVKRFIPAGGEDEDGTTRLDRILARVLALDDDQVSDGLAQVLSRFSERHRDFESTLESNFAAVSAHVRNPGDLSTKHRRLIGAYFTHEYSVEAAALSNPSVFLAPDQSGLNAGTTRIAMSLRSIGEGHISSIEFRTGTIDANGVVDFEVPGAPPITARHRSGTYVKEIFRQKLDELHANAEVAGKVLDSLGSEFTLDDLNEQIARVNRDEHNVHDISQATRTLHWLAASNYYSCFPDESRLSERVLFPSGPTESSGMEDARFVRFVEEDASVKYFATYTAYDGHQIMPQLIESTDLTDFRVATLNGACAKNKGIALFPRRIGGRYAALARLDNENNFYMTSEDVRFWHESQIIQRPSRPWELTHLGNCGSPIESDAGWLVITHGVGAMRQYALGAILLDLDDPTRVIGSLREPLLEPDESEREGYVPNVVYSCGSIIVGPRLILPYGFSDSGTAIATVLVSELLSELTSASCAT